jgi:hypothetical protein
MLGKKKMCLIVKSEEWYGISIWVNEDFDKEHDSPVMKKLLNDFPKSKRRVIFPRRDEIDMINEGGDIKIEPQHYLKDGVVKSLSI